MKHKINLKKISVVGLGKLGLPLAACFASRGFKTIGIDIQKNVIDSINRGLSPIEEPGLAQLIAEHQRNLRGTLNHKEAINKTDITFIIVATPSDKEGNFSNSYVESALKLLAKSLKENPKKYHLFIISSTVMPGSVEQRLIPIIEKYSGRKLNQGFGVCYIPDFVALGNTIFNFLQPDLVIIGESDEFAGEQAAAVYKKFCQNKPHIARMSIINAEIAKISLNNYMTLKMSFANSLGNLCERISGADPDVVSRAIGADKRIAPYYLKAGLSFGGTCFPRDTKAYLALAKKYNLKPTLIEAAEKVNRFQDEHLADLVLDSLRTIKSKKAAILGLAFKPQTPVIVESPAIKLIEKLLQKNIKITVYDALAMENSRQKFGGKINYASSVKNCLAGANLVVITIPEKKFSRLNSNDFSRGALIIDCWRILNPEKLGKRIKYLPLGKHNR